MTVKITYSGLGKLEDWYGHEDYYKQRTFKGIQTYTRSGNDITLTTYTGEEIKEDFKDIESIDIVRSKSVEAVYSKDCNEMMVREIFE